MEVQTWEVYGLRCVQPGDNRPGHLPTEKATTLIRRAGGNTAGAGSWGPSAVLAVTLLAAESWEVPEGVLVRGGVMEREQVKGR